ncbi:1009_t:CDS:2, partial [Racocetra fulgida]
VWDDSALISAWDHAVKEYQTGPFSEKPTKTEADTSTDQTQNEVDDSSVEETGHTHTHRHNSDSTAGDNAYYSAYGCYYYLQDPNMSYVPGWRPMQPPKVSSLFIDF